MRTYIIQLEQHDDLVSVRDKMSWAKSPRILLVWPPRRKVNIRPLDLVLLKRHASALGSRLGIVSRSGEIRRSAADSDIPAFRTAAEAQSNIWKTRPGFHTGTRKRNKSAEIRAMKDELVLREPAWSRSPAARAGVFSAGVLAVLAFFILMMPSATIKYTPITRPQRITIPIFVDPSATEINLSGIVPGYSISTTVEGKGELAATGKMTVPEGRAAAVVRFTNLTQSKVQIPEGTIVRTISDPAVRFYTTEVGEVPEGVGETIDLPVRAVEGGFKGNLPQNSLQSIEGSLGLSLSVTNPDPATGGVDAEKTSATDDDREKLYRQVEELLSAQALSEIDAQVPKGGLLIADSLYADDKSIHFDPPVGEPGADLSLNLEKEYHAFYIQSEDLDKLGSLALDSVLAQGYFPVQSSIVVVPMGSPTVRSDGTIAWKITAERLMAEKTEEFDIITKVLGKTPDSALRSLSEIKMAGPPKIALSPAWWILMPSIPMRITVEMEQ
jgi:hypothetical protein